MKIGDVIKCISGGFNGYGGPITEIYPVSDLLYFNCSDCGNVHEVDISECELTKPIHKGHHLTKIFQ